MQILPLTSKSIKDPWSIRNKHCQMNARERSKRDVEMCFKRTFNRRRSQEAVLHFVSQKNEDNQCWHLSGRRKCWYYTCIKQKCTIIISKSCEPNQPNPLFTQTSCKSTMMAEKRNVPEEVRVEGSLLETHRKDLVHEPVNHYAVLVINTNCLLKYNWPANKAAPRPRLALTLKAGAAWWSGDIHMISSWFFTTF